MSKARPRRFRRSNISNRRGTHNAMQAPIPLYLPSPFFAKRGHGSEDNGIMDAVPPPSMPVCLASLDGVIIGRFMRTTTTG